MERVFGIGASAFVCAGLCVCSSVAWAQSISDARVGMLDIRQNDAENNQRSVAVTVANGARLFSYPSENRGDFDVGFGTGNDMGSGIVIAVGRNRARDNASDGDVGGNIGGDLFATVSLNRNEPGRNQYIAVHGSPSGQEMNVDVAAVYFPYAAGFVAGHASNSTNNGQIDSLMGSPGLELGIDFVDPSDTTGTYGLDLRRHGHLSSEGVLLVCGGKNEDNYALSRANADGTFTVFCKDNGSNGDAYENDGVAFVYLPLDTEGLVAGRIAENSGTTPTVQIGTDGFTVTAIEEGSVLVRIDGVTDGDAGALLVSAEGGESRNQDNIVVSSWSDALNGYIVETRDVPGMGLQGLGGQPMFSFAYVPVVEGDGFGSRANTSTMVALPDTQLYAQNIPSIFHDQLQWIADEAESRDIGMVLHLGDITNRNNVDQWAVARFAFNRIHHGVEYILAQGNHDIGPNGNASTRDTLMNTYFPHSYISQNETHAGIFEVDHIENSYSLFNLAGRKWIVVALEWGPRDETLDWANGVLSQHEDRLAIIITHAYMYSDDTRMDQQVRNYGGSPYNYETANLPGGVNDGGDMYRKVVTQHPNVMMVLSGHIHGEGLHSGPTPFGNVVHEMLVDYQGRADGGEGFLRYMELTPDSNVVRVRTYSPTQDRYLTASKSHFEIELVTAPGHDGRVCAADIIENGVLNIDDVLGFLSIFAAGDSRADLNYDGAFDIDDVLDFLASFASGCV